MATRKEILSYLSEHNVSTEMLAFMNDFLRNDRQEQIIKFIDKDKMMKFYDDFLVVEDTGWFMFTGTTDDLIGTVYRTPECPEVDINQYRMKISYQTKWNSSNAETHKETLVIKADAESVAYRKLFSYIDSKRGGFLSYSDPTIAKRITKNDIVI